MSEAAADSGEHRRRAAPARPRAQEGSLQRPRDTLVVLCSVGENPRQRHLQPRFSEEIVHGFIPRFLNKMSVPSSRADVRKSLGEEGEDGGICVPGLRSQEAAENGIQRPRPAPAAAGERGPGEPSRLRPLPTAGAANAEGKTPPWSLWPGREVWAYPRSGAFSLPICKPAAVSSSFAPRRALPSGESRERPSGAGPAPEPALLRRQRHRGAGRRRARRAGREPRSPRGAHTPPVPGPGRGEAAGAERAGAPAASEMCKHRRGARRYLRGRG